MGGSAGYRPVPGNMPAGLAVTPARQRGSFSGRQEKMGQWQQKVSWIHQRAFMVLGISEHSSEPTAEGC